MPVMSPLTWRVSGVIRPSATERNISSRNSPLRSLMKKKPELSRFHGPAKWVALSLPPAAGRIRVGSPPARSSSQISEWLALR